MNLLATFDSAEEEEILIHTIPAKIAKGGEIRTPPQPRDGAAIKPAFDVESLKVSLDAVTANHGVETGQSSPSMASPATTCSIPTAM